MTSDETLHQPHQPLLSPEGHEPDGGIDYTPGVEYALDGFAPDPDSWLRARDVFSANFMEHDSVDAALRTALHAVGEDAETSESAATERFWNYVEGENGPHTRYGEAINDALDGYAQDGDTWFAGRDEFFGAIRHGASPEEALTQALSVAEENAESTADEAIARFEGSLSVQNHQQEYDEMLRIAMTNLSTEADMYLADNSRVSTERDDEGAVTRTLHGDGLSSFGAVVLTSNTPAEGIATYTLRYHDYTGGDSYEYIWSADPEVKGRVEITGPNEGKMGQVTRELNGPDSGRIQRAFISFALSEAPNTRSAARRQRVARRLRRDR